MLLSRLPVAHCRRLVIALLATLALPPAWAADLTVRFTDTQGKPVADAVVEVRDLARPALKAPASAATKLIDQRNEAFFPYLELFRPGDKVVFANGDKPRHHVYSFAPAGAFEFVLAPGERSPPVALDKPGTIAVGCNIHDPMIAYLYVSDAPWLSRSAADGRALVSGLPPGRYSVQAWHPRLWPGKKPEPQVVAVEDSGAASLQFQLRLTPDLRLRDPDSSYR